MGVVWPRGPNFIECVLPPHSWPTIVRYVSVSVGSPSILSVGLPSLLLDVRWAVMDIYYILWVCQWGGRSALSMFIGDCAQVQCSLVR